jgi:signal transduction histidine kinase
MQEDIHYIEKILEHPTQSDGIELTGIEERLKLLGGILKIDSRKGQGV